MAYSHDSSANHNYDKLITDITMPSWDQTLLIIRLIIIHQNRILSDQSQPINITEATSQGSKTSPHQTRSDSLLKLLKLD